ncbi:MAG: hypothetical protein A3C49_01990 [Candidatus Doudnabacteria bacterium RIFCSPHIGHO2_02_FULL_42_25]|uniref:Putative pre-16S rRNA nuclease n=1 Tax=Candidatus Doudnabacteria bacterium RIFCSPHIGHO2_01_FULL_41_86 TaxID=1817821 RepID=A0A1F5N951_9BACT|nr:MAG: hypothetical protein A2717_01585 [Candidatus Doudnabacteria bacterium RIFCSPHIGHO2_01_FULL_41_86]OGE75033.1 MAG: hypothetical protein A3K07_04665 [Candidatus Doudnabacteria bacterium RIFCSPHIGHO2_01_43_10]OGE85260.1 MAG: hypothetical protein A3E28_01155 [Candidatus Doudnabacteria bacterium RIFCSPHIGHO2_12_FULL_42_22]OGE86798.1 MAG: hypothetical protein A3C49_01990 [Candidatus Doudnabacteria bacterium RIFCSPHIGHO2_02_FULL_42_25]OGE92397.1 MAG: hypothetical protein A2895_02145 [Candidatus
MRILALDWGDVRIGAAISDPEATIAFPLDKVIDAKVAVSEIKKIITDLDVEKIIIGNPKNLSGDRAASATRVEDFVRILKEYTSCKFELVDERFSSVQARNKLHEAGMKEKKQRTIKDNIAAQIMLQQYLDTNK